MTENEKSTQLPQNTPVAEAVAENSSQSAAAPAENTSAENVPQDVQPSATQAEKSPKKNRRRFGDRKEGRRVRTLHAMNKFMPYIMARRSDACNTFADSFNIGKTDAFCRRKVKQGMVHFGMLHVILAAYVRTISQRPAINRFVSGQKIFARNEISVVMVIKRTMSINSPDTCIKVKFKPTDTVNDVYEKFNAVVQENSRAGETNSFDKLNRALLFIPGLFLRWTVKLLFLLDYFDLLPRKLLELSPFHGSMIITSMGSLGIKPIYHHIYDFGNLPVFLAYGTKRTENEIDSEGNVFKRKYIDLKAVTDERICDGYYYASAFKLFKRLVENPNILETPPETVVEDIE
ncbi:MAG: hypothetical protein PUJ09_07180 [Eubacteriales bacterium]|nr:hypothetical protein [Eubacteriales bacterium]